MTRDEIVRKSREAGGMFIVIPSVVKLDTELPLSAQMLYGIITWKCNSYAYTWATNRELGEALGVSAKRVSALLSQLEERGHVETEIEYKDGTREILRRYIYPVMKSARGILEDAPPPENEDTPPSEQAYPSPGAGIPPPENAEVICNKKRNKKDITPYSPPAGDGVSAEPKEGGPIEAQHSGFDGERRHSAANELSPQGKTRDAQLVPAKDKPRRFVPPSVEQVRAYCRERGNSIDPEAFVNYYASKGWTVGRAPMKDWRAAVRTWEQRRRSRQKEASEDDCFQ